MLSPAEYRYPVTEQGVVLPKSFFGDATEVTVSVAAGSVVIAAAANSDATQPAEANGDRDPILPRGSLQIEDWGAQPIDDDSVVDASINHDRDLYGCQE